MLLELEGYDWQKAFEYAGEVSEFGNDGSPNISTLTFGAKASVEPFNRENVKKIYGISEGEHDERSWIVYGQLKDKRWFYLEAGCDYTGWDCQAGGSAITAGNKKDLVRYGLTAEARERFRITLAA